MPDKPANSPDPSTREHIHATHRRAVETARALETELVAAHAAGADRDPGGLFASEVLGAWLFVHLALGTELPEDVEAAIEEQAVSASLP